MKTDLDYELLLIKNLSLKQKIGELQSVGIVLTFMMMILLAVIINFEYFG